ncbi:endonuclease/exonuclease/phosphatase family protein [Amycolatopsis sp. NPDC059027]|uniref:endonuclease/exonuclease/phosphatase family protein n=1 Tax=Amycolatopsis sp. NPDC059027 TaxID=3346709 RepID=UPI003671B736
MVVEGEVRARRGWVTFLLALVVLALVCVAALRLLGFDGNWYTLAPLSLTPYVAPLAVLVAVLALVLRRWTLGVLALVVAGAVAVLVVPRFSVVDQRAVQGRTLRVLASNLYVGSADPREIVDLVRSNQVDVLNLVELTPDALRRLDQAGLFTLLPYRVVHTDPGVEGSGIVSRFPLTETQLTGESAAKQPGARADLGDGVVIELVAVHPISPDVDSRRWEQEMKDLSAAEGEHGIRILAGDFNATLDHAGFRTVLARGYLDAAQQRGKSLTPTWHTAAPLVALDHVVVDRRAAVRDFRVFKVPGSDHRAVYAEIQLP